MNKSLTSNVKGRIVQAEEIQHVQRACGGREFVGPVGLDQGNEHKTRVQE